MIRTLITLICCLFVADAFSYDEEAKEEIFLSTPEQVATLNSEPGFLVGGIVSPLSGSPTLRQTDFVVKGAQELYLSRTYMSPHMPVQLANEKQCQEEWEKYYLYQHVAHNYKGWQFYPHLKLQFTPSEKHVLVTEPSGSTLSFVFTGSGMTHAKFEGELYGISNCAGDTPSGANDPRNTRITYGEDGGQITVHGTDKGTRIYRFSGWDTNTAQLYLLEKEILPNGKVLKYHYEGRQPTYVESLDPHALPKTISVELDGKVFVPSTDVQGNIRRLVDVNSKTLAASYDFTAFGEKLQSKDKGELYNPWQFASKRFDPSLNLIYFGKRYYDPTTGRWITTDPAGFKDSFNLYQYVLNSPFRYVDPNGANLLGFLCGVGQILAGGAIMASGVALEIATFGGYTFALGFHESAGIGLMMSGLATTTYHAQDIKFPDISWKNMDVYAPDRPLPRDPRTKEPVPEADIPHTELGTRNGTKGKYPQAREFDAQGKPVKDIDFTDHGRPKNHPNPHEHKWKPNPTGGTPQRSPEAEPLS